MINRIEDGEMEEWAAAVQKLKILLSKINLKELNKELVDDYKQMVEIAERM
ncbi:MAG: hypothetical protein RLO81_14635 [Fulvivirga sp.]|uniref:hypothetical protein n=1 Tax=Fulvivirga sp. TaxID=1931237 RepID=UPI0032EFA071